MPEKSIAVRVDEETYKKIRIRLAELGITLKEYIVTLVNEDIKRANEINLRAIPVNDSISKESVAEAQKVLDFVNDIMNGKYKK